MNRLEVPEKSYRSEISTMFVNHKRAMSSNWVVYSLFLGILFGLVVFIFMWFLFGDFDVYIVCNAALIGSVAFVIIVYSTGRFREKIIADMKSAEPFKGVCGFRGYSSHMSSENVTIVPTLAGKLHFVSCGDYAPFLVEKRSGQFYDYFEFKDVENLDQKDLRKFIAVSSDLD